eukprot:gene8740-3754_t
MRAWPPPEMLLPLAPRVKLPLPRDVGGDAAPPEPPYPALSPLSPPLAARGGDDARRARQQQQQRQCDADAAAASYAPLRRLTPAPIKVAPMRPFRR